MPKTAHPWTVPYEAAVAAYAKQAGDCDRKAMARAWQAALRAIVLPQAPIRQKPRKGTRKNRREIQIRLPT